MKILKAKTSHPKKKTYKINDLHYEKRMPPLQAILDGEDMIDPIELMKHEVFGQVRYGAGGTIYKEKELSVWRGNQRLQAAIQLGFTHIEGILLND